MINKNTVHPIIKNTQNDLIAPSPNNISYNMDQLALIKKSFSKKRIILNARGHKFDVLLEDFSRFPKTRLGKLKELVQEETCNPDKLLELCDDYDLTQNEYYFNRNSNVLSLILSYYNDGFLHYDINMCSKLFLSELTYWGFNEYTFDDCCQIKYFIQNDQIEDQTKEREEILDELYRKDNFGWIFPKIREYIWNIIDKPVDSQIHKIMRNQAYGIKENRTLCCSRIRKFFRYVRDQPFYYFIGRLYTIIYFFIIILAILGSVMLTLQPVIQTDQFIKANLSSSNEILIFNQIESSCMAFFSFEFITRLLICPSKIDFFLTPLNYIELIPILSFYLNFIGSVFSNAKEIFKMFLLFKFFRRSASLNMLTDTMKRSYKEIIIYIVYIGFGILIFSSFIYYLEKDAEGSKFTSIPAAFWWSVVTLTTLGYGDIFPTTVFGKLVGGFCAITSVFLLSMPMGLLASNFQENFVKHVKISRILKIHFGRKFNKNWN